jgi:hypothetical protein
LKALAQLPMVLSAIKNLGRPTKDGTPKALMQQILKAVLDLAESSCSVMEEAAARKQVMQRLRSASISSNPDNSAAAVATSGGALEDASDSAFWKEYKSAARMQTDIFEVFQSLQRNQCAWQLVPYDAQERVRKFCQLFCRLLQRFFRSTVSLLSTRVEEFGFAPRWVAFRYTVGNSARAATTGGLAPENYSSIVVGDPGPCLCLDPRAVAEFDAVLDVAVRTVLLPSSNFLQDRERIRDHMRSLLIASQIGAQLPPETGKMPQYNALSGSRVDAVMY